MTIVFDNPALLPSTWLTPEAARSARVFNPALLRDGSGWLLAYRVVTEPSLRRRIALCRLDEEFRVVAGSQLPLSDLLAVERTDATALEATVWFADPRLYRLGGRIFLYWNSGWHEPQNHQFLQELDANTLRPLGSPRELLLRGNRQKLEKNWSLFEHDGVYAIYSVNPYRVLATAMQGDGPIECADAALPLPNADGFAQNHGGLRGGAPPQRVDDHFYSFCHSIEDGESGYRYVASVYRFAAKFPFAATDMPHEPLKLSVPTSARRSLPKLNAAVAEVVYPAGAAFVNGHWAVSFGIDDERCAIAVLSMQEVVQTLTRV
jgi:hypothetical protein